MIREMELQPQPQAVGTENGDWVNHQWPMTSSFMPVSRSLHKNPKLYNLETFQANEHPCARRVKVTQSCVILCDPWTIHSPWNSPGQNTGVGRLYVAFPFFRGSSQPRDWTQVSCFVCRFFTQLSHRGSPRILEEGSLSLLQPIFQIGE